MGQLKMIRFGGHLKEGFLPRGYKFEFFKGSEQEINDWLSICSNGLTPNKNPKWFDKCIATYPHLVPQNDLFFVVDECGKPVATTSAVTRQSGEGYIHMVAVLFSCRGKGIGRAMLWFAVTELQKRGSSKIVLTTDDFRLSAIKTYLDAQFKPVIYNDGQTDMKSRWDDVLLRLNYRDVDYMFKD